MAAARSARDHGEEGCPTAFPQRQPAPADVATTVEPEPDLAVPGVRVPITPSVQLRRHVRTRGALRRVDHGGGCAGV
jgi:hypothetical protein